MLVQVCVIIKYEISVIITNIRNFITVENPNSNFTYILESL